MKKFVNSPGLTELKGFKGKIVGESIRIANMNVIMQIACWSGKQDTTKENNNLVKTRTTCTYDAYYLLDSGRWKFKYTTRFAHLITDISFSAPNRINLLCTRFHSFLISPLKKYKNDFWCYRSTTQYSHWHKRYQSQCWYTNGE